MENEDAWAYVDYMSPPDHVRCDMGLKGQETSCFVFDQLDDLCGPLSESGTKIPLLSEDVQF